jgi:uncharacterized protein (DUF1778 family)
MTADNLRHTQDAMSKSESRRANSVISVRCTPDQRELLERAARKLVEDVPGARLGLSALLLEAGLARAREVVGEGRKR